LNNSNDQSECVYFDYIIIKASLSYFSNRNSKNKKREKERIFIFFFKYILLNRRTYTTTTATKKIYDKIIKKSIYTYIFLPYYYILI